MDVHEMAQLYAAERPVAYNAEAWWEYAGTHYREVSDRYMDGRVRLWLVEKGEKPTPGKVRNLLDQIRAVVHWDGPMPGWLGHRPGDPPPEQMIAFRNGLLDVAAGRLLDHTHRWFAPACLPYAFAPAAGCPAWLAFVREALVDDQQIGLLQEWFGYCLTPDTRQQKFLLMVGPRGSGKGTTLDVMASLVGDHNTAAVTPHSLAGPFGVAQLVGRTLATCGEIHLDRRDAQPLLQVLKSVTGRDRVPVNRKNRPEVQARLTCRFAFGANQLPRLADDSGALLRRLLLIEFPSSFEDRADPGLGDRLLAELPGIAGWALAGLERLRVRGRFVQPDRGKDALADFAALSSPVSAFVTDCCQTGPDCWEETDWLFRAWELWCQAERHESGSKVGFGSRLKAAVPGIRNLPRRPGGRLSRQVRAYYGIKLGNQGVHLLGREATNSRRQSRGADDPAGAQACTGTVVATP